MASSRRYVQSRPTRPFFRSVGRPRTRISAPYAVARTLQRRRRCTAVQSQRFVCPGCVSKLRVQRARLAASRRSDLCVLSSLYTLMQSTSTLRAVSALCVSKLLSANSILDSCSSIWLQRRRRINTDICKPHRRSPVHCPVTRRHSRSTLSMPTVRDSPSKWRTRPLYDPVSDSGIEATGAS